MPFGPRLKAIKNLVRAGKAGRVSGRDLSPGNTIMRLQACALRNDAQAHVHQNPIVRPEETLRVSPQNSSYRQ
jgi:hypothetical protein